MLGIMIKAPWTLFIKWFYFSIEHFLQSTSKWNIVLLPLPTVKDDGASKQIVSDSG